MALDALEEVGVTVGPSAAVTKFPDAGPEFHGTPVAHTALPGDTRRGHARYDRYAHYARYAYSISAFLQLYVFGLRLLFLSSHCYYYYCYCHLKKYIRN